MDEFIEWGKQGLRLAVKYVRRLGSSWLEGFRGADTIGKAIFAGLSLVGLCLLCAVCYLPIAMLSPDATATPEESERAIAVLDEEDPREEREPVATDTAEPTSTTEPSKTPEPTGTLQPTATDTPSPTDTPTSEPTNTPLPTNTLQPTRTPAPPTHTPTPLPTATQLLTRPIVIISAVNKRAEFVDLLNPGDAPLDLTNWVLLSEKGNQRCVLAATIQPGQTLRVWALAEDVGQGGFNCQFGSPIWNNSERDPAVLFDNNGLEIDRF